jgi:hypothetical protein
VLDEGAIPLGRAVSVVRSVFAYEYDFGDSWHHKILLEKILPVDDTITYPICIDGERACPPDDCGGTWRYMHILEALKNPQDPENVKILDWLGEDFFPEDFDPEAFNPADVNPNFRYINQILRWD